MDEQIHKIIFQQIRMKYIIFYTAKTPALNMQH